MKNVTRALSLSAFGLLDTSTSAHATECIAPANLGGFWDFTCRQIANILFVTRQIDAPMVVANMAGTVVVGFTFVVADRNDDPDLIVAAPSATTMRLAQNAFAGATADQVRFLGAIARDPGVIEVAKERPRESLGEMVAAIKADPGSVAFAGGWAVGGCDYMKPFQVMKAAGFDDITKSKYFCVDGGADAITQTVGGFTQAMTGDLSEIGGFTKSGDVRALAVLTEERVPGFENIPTTKEQGFDVVAVNWRWLYEPKGISDHPLNALAAKLQVVADSPVWKASMEANGLAPFVNVGGNFQAWVDVIVRTVTLSKEIGGTP
jgi:putative tricarboxylic transport membrane protein